jgi:hypothetical protein
MELIEYQIRSRHRFILIQHIYVRQQTLHVDQTSCKNNYPIHGSNITYMGVLIYGMIILFKLTKMLLKYVMFCLPEYLW